MDPIGQNHNWLLGTNVNKKNLVKWIVDLRNKIPTPLQLQKKKGGEEGAKTAPDNIVLL